MNRLLVVTKAIGVSTDNDISQLIPDFTQMRSYAFGIWNQIVGNQSCDCDHHSVATNVAGGLSEHVLHSFDSLRGTNPNMPFGGYSNMVHEAPNHKCWPYGGNQSNTGVNGSMLPNGDVSLKPGCGCNFPMVDHCMDKLVNELKDQFVHSLNVFTLKTLVHVLEVKNCIPQGTTELGIGGKIYKALSSILHYLSDATTLQFISGIQSVDMRSNGSIWHNVILITLTDDAAINNLKFRALVEDLGALGITFRTGTQPQISRCLQENEHILNWNFGISIANPEFIHFVFFGCRGEEKDQHSINISTTQHIAADVPHNVGLLVDHNHNLSILLRVANGYCLGYIGLGITDVSLDDAGIAWLSTQGIEVCHVMTSCNFNEDIYAVNIKEVKKDMNLHFKELQVLSSIKSYCLTTQTESDLEFVGVLDSNMPNQKIRCSVQFELEGNPMLSRRSGVHVYVLPVGLYDIRDIGSSYEVPSEIIEKPSGRGVSNYYTVTMEVNSKLINLSQSVLVRVVFEENSLRFTLGDMRYVNATFAVQFECVLNSNHITTSYCGLCGDQHTWEAPRPFYLTLPKMSYKYEDIFSLMPAVNGRFELTNLNPIVQTGATNPMTYQIKDIYAENNETDVEWYFAQVLVPIHIFNKEYYDSTDTLKLINVDMSVESRFNAAFFMNYESLSIATRTNSDDTQRTTVIYNKLERPILNGFIEVPIVFKAHDEVVIVIQSTELMASAALIVDTNIMAIPAEENPDENVEKPGNDGENPPNGNEPDEPVTDDKKDKENTGEIPNVPDNTGTGSDENSDNNSN